MGAQTSGRFAIRRAEARDGAVLDAFDCDIWDLSMTPSDLGSGSRPRFGVTIPVEDTWIAEAAGQVAGYVVIGRRTSLESNRHVGLLRAIAVAPTQRGTSLAQELMGVAIAAARERGMRKLCLTVLGSNPRAIAFYKRHGFVVEGTLRDEFLLRDVYVDDVLMALDLASYAGKG